MIRFIWNMTLFIWGCLFFWLGSSILFSMVKHSLDKKRWSPIKKKSDRRPMHEKGENETPEVD